VPAIDRETLADEDIDLSYLQAPTVRPPWTRAGESVDDPRLIAPRSLPWTSLRPFRLAGRAEQVLRHPPIRQNNRTASHRRRLATASAQTTTTTYTHAVPAYVPDPAHLDRIVARDS
jgi:hypothetical protein